VNDIRHRGPSGPRIEERPRQAAVRGGVKSHFSLWRSRRALPLLIVPLLVGRIDLPRGERAQPETGSSATDVSESAVLPLHVNDRVRTWMQRFRTGQRAEFEQVLRRRGAYEGLIRERLRARGMPDELLYLAMMESGLKPRATSAACAVGLWQFMAPTAQQYGLRVDEWVDERRDPVRATNAALDYLSWLHDRYGSWYLAAAAYDAGPGRVDRVLARHPDGKAQGENLYWEVSEYLPRETREYVPRLVAASLLARDADAAGFESDVRPYRYDRVFVPGGTSLRAIARIVGVEQGVIRNLNPHLIQGVTPPNETYPVRVPVGTAGKVVAGLGKSRTLRKAD
jgi:membrane-bound lytic murein transglycosylase D